MPIDGVGELVAMLRRLESNRRELAEIRANIDPSLWLTPEQHCEALGVVYRELHSTVSVNAVGSALGGISGGVPGGVSVHPVLSALRRFPPNWPQADWPRFPALPDPNVALRNPLQARIAAYREALADRVFDTRDLVVWIDSMGGYGPRGAIQVCGWLETDTDRLDDMNLMIRSCNGELILRPVYLHERPDLMPSDAPGTRLGFLSDPFAPELIEDDGVYGLELAFWTKGRLSLCPLSAAISCRDGARTLIQSNSKIVTREPFADVGPTSAVNTKEGLIQYWLDEFSVESFTRDLVAPIPVLAVNGWLLGPCSQGQPVSTDIVLRGRSTYCSTATPVDRPDVLEAFSLASPLRCGFQGRVWLGSLPVGRYSVFLRCQGEHTCLCDVLVGELIIGADAIDAVAHEHWPSGPNLAQVA